MPLCSIQLVWTRNASLFCDDDHGQETEETVSATLALQQLGDVRRDPPHTTETFL